MKKWNLFYWIVAPALVLVLYYLSNQFSLSHDEYYGEAEARQTEINLDQDVLVKAIYAETGQKVKKGDTLLVAENKDVNENIEQLDFQRKGAEAEMALEKAGTDAKIFELQQEKQTKLAELQTKYNTARAEVDFFRRLAGNQTKTTTTEHPNQALLTSLQEEMKKTGEEYDRQIDHLRKMKQQRGRYTWTKEQLARSRKHLQQHQQAFIVTAPYDGIVGHINVRQGEHVESYTSLITFMEPNPSEVKGYVPEKYTVNIRVGDTVAVVSKYHPEKMNFGIISAVGNRVVEIPEKFSKLPDMKTYGIEVFIRIPLPNPFFQKEIIRVKPWGKE